VLLFTSIAVKNWPYVHVCK